MKNAYRNYLKPKYKSTTINSYLSGINHISQHYGSDIFQITDPEIVDKIRAQYDLHGEYRSIGEYGKGAARASIRQYSNFVKLAKEDGYESEMNNENEIQDAIAKEDNSKSNAGFTYERDLHNSLKQQATELFPGYNIIGTEYTIGNGRVDLLLENDNELLAIELKSGTAFAEVFGQISMYIGLLKQEFPDKNIKGIIIASEIHEGLKYACDTNPSITCKIYKMKLSLESL